MSQGPGMSAKILTPLIRGSFLTDEQVLYEITRVFKDGSILVENVKDPKDVTVLVPVEYKEMRVVEVTSE